MLEEIRMIQYLVLMKHIHYKIYMIYIIIYKIIQIKK